MRVVSLFMVFWFFGVAFAENNVSSDRPTKDTYEVAKKFGYTNKKEIWQLNRELSQKIDTSKIEQEIAKAMESDPVKMAELTETALQNLLSRADGVLRNMGHDELADQIFFEYDTYYRGAIVNKAMGIKEIGDHPPLSEWLDTIHTKIEEAIGQFFCDFFHFHDIFIINHALPVVFNPSKYQLKDYLDHFSGHLIWGFWWEHHGLAGVITYWTVEVICSVSTGGVGLAVFACGPIAGLAEHLMDKRIAPPIGKRIWQRYNP